MTSNDLKRPQLISKESFPIIEMVKRNTSTKNTMKGCKKIEINDKYLVEMLHNKNL